MYTDGCVGTLAAKLLVVKQTEMSLTAVQFIRPVSTIVVTVTEIFRLDTFGREATFNSTFPTCYTHIIKNNLGKHIDINLRAFKSC